MADISVWRTRHPLDSQWEFLEVRKGGVHELSLDIDEALVLYHRLEEVLSIHERMEYCPTCGAAPYTFVDGDCPKCNPPVSSRLQGRTSAGRYCCAEPGHSCCTGHR